MTQETRQLEILRPAVKEIIRAEVVKRIPEHVRRAFAVATSGRPGPVLIDIPEDIAHAEYEFDAADFWIDESTTRIPSRMARPDQAELDYTQIARGFGCLGIRVNDPEKLNEALREGLANVSSPTVIDVVVTLHPAKMLPAADNRTLKVEKGDRPV